MKGSDNMDDESIIELFLERSEQAIAELSQKYGGVFMKVAMNALGSREDAEECVNDAYLGLWNAIPPARPKPLLAFACRLVRNKSIDRYRSRGFKHSGSGYEESLEELSDILSSPASVEDEVEGRLLSEHIDAFIRTRSDIDRMIFVRRFFYMDKADDIAKASGLSNGAVRTRLSRMKAELKTYLIGKGVSL